MMTISHDMIGDDLPGYALGTLDPDSAAVVERHLTECAECRRVLDEYQEVLRLLPLGLPVAEPSPASRVLLLARVRTSRAGKRRSRKRQVWRWWLAHPVAAATVALLLVAGTVGIVIFQQSDDSNVAAMVARMRDEPGARVVPMHGSAAAPGAMGHVVLVAGNAQAGLIVSGLPQLPDGRSYQLWFVRPDETRISGGVFTVDSDGDATVLVDVPAEYGKSWRCGVTDEPAGGSPAPTGTNVLRGEYPDEWSDDYWS